MTHRLQDGYHYVRGMANGLDDTTLTIWVQDGLIEAVNIHTKGNQDLRADIYTPQNVKTRKNTTKQTTNHSDGTTSKNNVVQLTFEEVIQ